MDRFSFRACIESLYRCNEFHDVDDEFDSPDTRRRSNRDNRQRDNRFSDRRRAAQNRRRLSLRQ